MDGRHPVQVQLCQAFGFLVHALALWRGRSRLRSLCSSLAVGMVHLAERASAYGLEGEQGIVGAGVRRWEVFGMEVHLQLRAAPDAVAEESHKPVHRGLVWGGTSTLHV